MMLMSMAEHKTAVTPLLMHWTLELLQSSAKPPMWCHSNARTLTGHVLADSDGVLTEIDAETGQQVHHT